MILAIDAVSAALFLLLAALAARRAIGAEGFAFPYFFLSLSFIIVFLVSLSNILERTLGSAAIDQIEEYLEILIVPFILLFAYSWSITEREKRIEGYARELHHRIKNNLQTIESMLELQAREAEGDAAERLALAGERVAAIGLCERLSLERGAPPGIDMGRYLGAIAARVEKLAPMERKGLAIEIECGASRLPPYEAVVCALLMMEIAVRADGKRLRAVFRDEGDHRFSLVFAGAGIDGACGYPLIDAFAGQLRADTRKDAPDTASFTFSAQPQEYRKWAALAF